MGCIQQAMSSLELAIVILQLPGDLLPSHAFACRVLVCFINRVTIFKKGERTNAVSEGCSAKYSENSGDSTF